MTITNNNAEYQPVIDEIRAIADNLIYEWFVYDELPKEPPHNNVIAIVGKHDPQDIYYSVDNSWVRGGSLSIEEDKDEWIITSTNCSNCGAPVNKRNEECEYCGTPYAKMRSRRQ